MRTPVALALVGIALLGLPVLAPAYHVTLMLPFMAYGVVLLGMNLLFGYTGLVSFGHALFVGVGAYTAAVLTTHLHIRHLEVILPAAALGTAAKATSAIDAAEIDAVATATPKITDIRLSLR